MAFALSKLVHFFAQPINLVIALLLLAFLLGIEKPEQVSRDPLVGQMFENLIVM